MTTKTRKRRASALLDAVAEARELRDLAADAFGAAIVRASEGGYSLAEIAAPAGLHRTAVRYIIRRERGTLPSRAKTPEERTTCTRP